jgi:hypothetical protein
VQREGRLIAVAITLTIVTIAAVLAIPGAIQSHEQPEREGHIDVAEVTIASGPVSGATATLHLTTYLQHRGNPSTNVTVVTRSIDAETGFETNATTTTVGRVTGDREVSLNQSLRVDREGGYHIETILYANGRRVDTRRHTVRGVGSLVPAGSRTAVEFHRFGSGQESIPPIQYSVVRTGDSGTVLNVSAYLTNTGNGPSGDLRLELTARQADSNIIANRSSIRIGRIPAGNTATPATRMRVPAEYNYYLDAVLWKDGVIVGSTQSVANLDPTERIEPNVTRRDVGLEVSDFTEDETPRPRRGEAGRAGADRPMAQPTGTPAAGPGFGVGMTILALIAFLGGRRWNQ